MQDFSFENFYNSTAQQPILLWAATALGLVGISRTRIDLTTRRFCVALVVLSLLDAWLTANHVFGIGALAGPAAFIVPTFFVLAGDYRYFLFLEASRGNNKLNFSWPVWIRALLWTLIVPISSKAFPWLLGAEYAAGRHLYFAYELLFAALVALILFLYIPARSVGSAWPRRVSAYVIIYYSLWAVSDALILWLRSDFGFLLRTIPNLLYYAGFPVIIAVFQSHVSVRSTTDS